MLHKFRIHESFRQNRGYERQKLSIRSVDGQNQNQNFTGVRPMTFIHQDLWNGNLVPSSHQRGKPSHTILYTFSRGNNRIWKGIPISEWFREEWALVKVSSCIGDLKSQWVMSSTVPICGELIICWNAGSILCTNDSAYCLSLSSFSLETPILVFPLFQSYSQFQSNSC